MGERFLVVDLSDISVGFKCNTCGESHFFSGKRQTEATCGCRSTTTNWLESYTGFIQRVGDLSKVLIQVRLTKDGEGA